MRYPDPTREQVDPALKSKNPIRLDDVGVAGEWSRYATTHPQWGGYCSPCSVEFRRPEPTRGVGLPCFNVWEFHDGEYPTDECQGSRHYCSPDQLIRFGVEVIEMMMKEGHKLSPRDVEDLRDLGGRLAAILGSGES